MHVTSLRKVGGSVMLAVPPALLDVLKLSVGAQVGLQIENDRLVIAPRPRPKYTMEELLAECDYSDGPSAEDREWLDSPPVGREIL